MLRTCYVRGSMCTSQKGKSECADGTPSTTFTDPFPRAQVDLGLVHRKQIVEVKRNGKLVPLLSTNTVPEV